MTWMDGAGDSYDKAPKQKWRNFVDMFRRFIQQGMKHTQLGSFRQVQSIIMGDETEQRPLHPS